MEARVRTRRAAFAAAVLSLSAGAARGEAPPYETVVSAPREDERPRADLAASASVVTGDRTPRSGESLPQLLSELPGVSVTRTGGLGSVATLSIRGSAANQVLVYLDGVPLNSATFGAVDLGLLSLAGLERIEVYRGMSPIAFGASALGGIVALESRVPRETGAAAHAGAGSYGTRLGGGELVWAGRRLRLLGAASHVASEGDFPYPDDNGTAFDPSDDRVSRRQNNRFAQTDALVRAAVPLGERKELLATVSFLDRAQELPPFALQRAEEATTSLRRFLGIAAYDGRDDRGRLRAVGYVASTEARLDDPRGEIGLVPARTQDRTTAIGGSATGGRALAGWLRLSAVADVRHEAFEPFDALGNVRTGPPATRLFGAAGVEPHVHLAPAALDLVPSLRLELARDEVAGRDSFGGLVEESAPHTYRLPVARVGAVQRPTAWLALRANGGRYARLPTTFERYGNTGRTLGNRTLRPELGLNADAGATASWGAAEASGGSVDLAVFAARVHDLIDWQQGGGRLRARNVDEARILGVEASAALRLGRFARLAAQGTYTDARDAGEIAARRGKQLPHRPRLRAYGRPELRRLPLPGGLRLGLYADLDVTGGNYLDPANLVHVPARVLVGAGLHLAAPSAGWRLVASALNLGDAHVNDLAGFPLPGRSVFLTLEWSTHARSKEIP